MPTNDTKMTIIDRCTVIAGILFGIGIVIGIVFVCMSIVETIIPQPLNNCQLTYVREENCGIQKYVSGYPVYKTRKYYRISAPHPLDSGQTLNGDATSSCGGKVDGKCYVHPYIAQLRYMTLTDWYDYFRYSYRDNGKLDYAYGYKYDPISLTWCIAFLVVVPISIPIVSLVTINLNALCYKIFLDDNASNDIEKNTSVKDNIKSDTPSIPKAPTPKYVKEEHTPTIDINCPPPMYDTFNPS